MNNTVKTLFTEQYFPLQRNYWHECYKIEDPLFKTQTNAPHQKRRDMVQISIVSLTTRRIVNIWYWSMSTAKFLMALFMNKKMKPWARVSGKGHWKRHNPRKTPSWLETHRRRPLRPPFRLVLSVGMGVTSSAKKRPQWQPLVCWIQDIIQRGLKSIEAPFPRQKTQKVDQRSGVPIQFVSLCLEQEL